MKSEVIITEQELPSEVIDAIKGGKKIVAIKLLRESTGLGLANAKVLVDRAAAKHVGASPSPALVQEENSVAKLFRMLLLVVLMYTLYKFLLNS